MNYVETLKRAFRITVKYRALWLFGFLLALCGGGGGGGGNGGGGTPSSSGNNQWNNGSNPFKDFNMPNLDQGTIIGLIAAAILLIFILIVVGVIVRSVSRAALIGMVDQSERTGAVTIKDGWRIGWSAKAWRVFLLNLAISIPMLIITLASLALVASPLLLGLAGEKFLILGAIIAIGLLLLWILGVIVVGVLLTPFIELGWRYTVLQEKGVLESLKIAYSLIRQNLKDITITVLLLIGVGIAWGMVSIILAIIIILLALLIGGIPGLIGYMLTQNVVVAIIAGVPLFLIVLVIPLTFVTGLYLIFQSAVWTLVFRHLTGADTPTIIEAEPPAEPEPAPTNPADDSPVLPDAPTPM